MEALFDLCASVQVGEVCETMSINNVCLITSVTMGQILQILAPPS